VRWHHLHHFTVGRYAAAWQRAMALLLTFTAPSGAGFSRSRVKRRMNRYRRFSDVLTRRRYAYSACPKTPHATEPHTAPLRPACRSIPAVRFRHSAELNGATKAPLVSPLLPLRTQRRTCHIRASEPQTSSSAQ
jgi:hypothetical protein